VRKSEIGKWGKLSENGANHIREVRKSDIGKLNEHGKLENQTWGNGEN